MNRLNVLILQERPSHQIILHQACNALGVFNVQLADDLQGAKACLSDARPFDLLVLDHAMAPGDTGALLDHLGHAGGARALLFMGQPRARCPNLAQQARQRGFWSICELSWPISMLDLERALKRLRTASRADARDDFQTVTLHAHAR